MEKEKQSTPVIHKKKNSQFRNILRRFMINQTAVFGLVIIFLLVIFALFPSQLSHADYTVQDLANRYSGPSAEHWLGTDELGRDMYTRIVWGCRTSLTIGLASVAIACAIGVTLGTLAGYFGGVLDNVLMRIVDILMAVPNLLLGISIVAALGNSITVLVFAIALGNIAAFSRVTRSSVITVRDTEYVEAARATGASDGRIMWKYVLPNALAPIIVQVTTSLAGSILNISGLSFVGLGVPAPTPEWGSMLSNARTIMRDYPLQIMFPGIAIMLTVFAFNLFGDGLRDALDPRLKN